MSDESSGASQTGSSQDESRWWDATTVAEKVAAGEVSAAEMTEAAIARIESGDAELNAVVIRWFDHAREVAASDLPDGPFRGVPFLLKDLWIQYAGQGRTDGNVAMAANPPISSVDSVLVGRFKRAGLVTLGRSASPEMGTLPVTETVAHGATRNPWNTDYVPGGSSGGAAAAVAAGFVPIAHASDGGGSIRIPASCCGLVGLKTSQGRISMQGHGIETGLGVDFCVSRSVRDSARLLDAVQGPGVGDSIIAPPPHGSYVDEVGRDPGSLRIGLLDYHPQGGGLHDDCIAAVRGAAATLERLGHHVADSHPATLDDASFTSRFMAMWAAGRRVGLTSFEKALGRALTEEEVEPQNWAQAQFADQMTASQYADALSAVAEYRRATQQWWADGWDLLLTPTLAEPPPRIGEMLARPDDPMAGMARAGEVVPFTPPFNTSGQPAISLPLYWADSGLPIGVQLVAGYGREDVLFAVAAQLEEAMPWADRHPPL
ncbi:MAG: amidase [Acidimicrobiales bacterium]|nr:amidase [Acidimicrobiales bacterium]